MRVISTIFLLVIIGTNTYANESDLTYIYENKEVGVYIEKPSNWYFISKQTAIDNRKNVRLKDKEFQKKYFNSAQAPLVVINKYKNPESIEGVTPTVQVLLTPSPKTNMSSEQVLNMSLQVFVNNTLSFKYIEKTTPIIISGHNGAKALFTYTLDTNLGYKINVKARTYVVKRGGYFFIVSMAGPNYGSDISDNEFLQIIKSLKIEK